MFYVKKIMMFLLGVIFVALIVGSVQSTSADHLEPGTGIFLDETEVELVNYWTTLTSTTQGSSYQVYIQTVLRNGDEQLISITETARTGAYIPHKITDHVFDTLMGKKEIVTIDNIKYEKVQYTFSPTLEQRTAAIYPIFEETPLEFVGDEDAITGMKEDIKFYYRWKIDYCASFEGHPYTCIPVFQAFTVISLVTPTDVVTHQWTILRGLN